MSKYINVQVRKRGSKVLLTTDHGIQWGVISGRDIDNDDKVIYSIKVEGRQHYKKRKENQVFDTLEEMMLHYKKLIK